MGAKISISVKPLALAPVANLSRSVIIRRLDRESECSGTGFGADGSRALVDVGCDRPSYGGQQVDLVASLVATRINNASRRLQQVARTH